jgi:hypothetical protein
LIRISGKVKNMFFIKFQVFLLPDAFVERGGQGVQVRLPGLQAVQDGHREGQPADYVGGENFRAFTSYDTAANDHYQWQIVYFFI